MGREHRLQGNARVRQESARRPARIPASVPAEILNVEIARDAPIVGIDVGEKLLDLAVLASGRRRLRFSRIDLTGCVGTNPIATLADALAERVPELRRGAIAVVDSPRCPVDLDCSTSPFSLRADAPPTRAIDAALRTLVRDINFARPPRRGIKFALFPTPRLDYFARAVADGSCPPHLRAFGAQMIPALDARFASRAHLASLTGGALFTRFMLAGFAVFRALAALNVKTFEGYPYLAFKLWMNSHDVLPPKNRRRVARASALEARAAILRRLSASMPHFTATPPTDCDQADAAILATTLALASRALRGRAIAEIRCHAEGRLIVALNVADAKAFASARASRGAPLPA